MKTQPILVITRGYKSEFHRHKVMVSNYFCSLAFKQYTCFSKVSKSVLAWITFAGGTLGCGVYFAKDASYSVDYAGDPGANRYMYLARVLVGEYCTGNFDLIVPPPKDPSRPEVLHDSVVDQCENPNIFVVFFDNQCYPEYLITF